MNDNTALLMEFLSWKKTSPRRYRSTMTARMHFLCSTPLAPDMSNASTFDFYGMRTPALYAGHAPNLM
eukprot:10721660-Lingulodinium_polyedra.AAC.1